MTRPAEHLVHGLDGPVVILSARVCAYLNRYAGLDRFRSDNRGTDPEVDNALVAMRIAALKWQGSATGTKQAPQPELAASLQWLSTTQAAGQLKVSDRAIRKAIAERRLNAESVAGRWRISRTEFEHYKARKTN